MAIVGASASSGDSRLLRFPAHCARGLSSPLTPLMLDQRRLLVGGWGRRNRRGFRYRLRQRRRLALKRCFQHLFDPAYRANVETVLDLVRDLGEILDVFFRNKHGLDAT